MTDALSTAIMVMGKQNGLDLIASLEGVHGVLVGKDMAVSISARMPFSPS